MKRWISILLAAAILLGLLPLSAAAEEKTDIVQPLTREEVVLPISSGGGSAASREDAGKTGNALGYIPDQLEGSTTLTDAYLEAVKSGGYRGTLPSSYDSRNYGCIPAAIRNQNPYGSCWAHAAVASSETYMIKHGVKDGSTGQTANTNINLSEYHLVWFTYNKAYDKLGLLNGDETSINGISSTNPAGDKLDFGGNGTWAGYTLMRWEGLAPESIPALAYNNITPQGISASYAYQYDAAHVQSFTYVPATNAAKVKELIMEYGAGLISYYHEDAYLNPSTAAYYNPSATSTNHGVTVIGWDDNYSASNFNDGARPKSNGAWLCRNSWGSGWGNGGYFYLSYEDPGVLSTSCFFYEVEASDNYDNIYQYDGTLGTQYGSLPNGYSVANTFTAVGDEKLEAVSIATVDEDVQYSLYIYTAPSSASNPSSGKLAAQQSGTISYPGYHTVKLTAPVLLRAGQSYSVCFVLNAPGDSFRIPFDTSTSNDLFTYTHVAGSGKSYYGSGSTWRNLDEDMNAASSFRIKAYTKNVTSTGGTVDLQLYAQGEVYQTLSGNAGTLVELPSTAPSIDGYEFIGWTPVSCSDISTAPAYYAPGETFLLDGSYTALYALYRALASASSSYAPVEVTPADWTGTYVITTTATNSGYAIKGVSVDTGSAYPVQYACTSLNSAGITLSGGTLTGVSSLYTFRIAAVSSGIWSIQSIECSSYLGIYNNVLYLNGGYYAQLDRWELTAGSGGACTLHSLASTTTPYVGVDSSGKPCSSDDASSRIYLWKLADTYSTTVHNHKAGTPVKENELLATCTGNGSYDMVSYCTICGIEMSRTTSQTSPLGHDYQGVPTAATCTEPGYTTYTCSRCSDSYVGDYTDLAPHDYMVAVSEPSCTTPGYTYYICSVCGYSYSEISAQPYGHEYLPYVTSPTCTEGGYTTYTCSRCGDSYTDDEKAPLGHDYVDEVIAPTCTERGYTTYTCAFCFDTYVADETAPLGHSWGEPTYQWAGDNSSVTASCVCTRDSSHVLTETVQTTVTIDAPDCTSAGSRTYTATFQNSVFTTQIKTVTVDAVGHKPGEAVTENEIAATCTEPGGYDTVVYCTVCGEEISRVHTDVAALGHTPGEAVIENNVVPTCTTAGGYDTVISCTVCGKEISRVHTELAPLGHEYELTGWVWSGFTSASAIFTCKKDASHVETVKAEIVSVRTEPTADEEGSVVYTATVNFEGNEYTDVKTETLPALGHEYELVGWTWTEYSAASATFLDKTDNREITVEAIIHSVRTEPTCELDGSVVYTATVLFAEQEYSDVQTEILEALGHAWTEPTYVWAEDYSEITATRTCKNDASHIETEKGKITSEVTLEATYDAEGEIIYTATFTNPAFETQTETVVTPKLEKPSLNNPFVDVKEGDYFYNAVLWAVGHDPQITNGTDKTHFSPNAKCTRGQVVTFLWRAKGCPEPTTSNNPFNDVKSGEYYYKAVLWAVGNEITSGTDKTHFSPNAKCTRGQVVTFLWRTEGKPSPTSTENPFKDVTGGYYYYDAVLWAVENKITAGTSADKFSPNATCTRGQVVTFLYRAFAG